MFVSSRIRVKSLKIFRQSVEMSTKSKLTDFADELCPKGELIGPPPVEYSTNKVLKSKARPSSKSSCVKWIHDFDVVESGTGVPLIKTGSAIIDAKPQTV